MANIKSIFQNAARLFKQAWLLPRTISLGLQQRRDQFALDVLEAERLDRLRNPSKYLGKS